MKRNGGVQNSPKGAPTAQHPQTQVWLSETGARETLTGYKPQILNAKEAKEKATKLVTRVTSSKDKAKDKGNKHRV